MSIESALRELGREIQKDERFQNHMQELQLISLKYQQEAEKCDQASQEKIEEHQKNYQKLYSEIMENENMQKYSAAASEMEQMAQYISGMIGLFFDGQDADTCQLPQDGCTHNCSTCGGCH